MCGLAHTHLCKHGIAAYKAGGNENFCCSLLCLQLQRSPWRAWRRVTVKKTPAQMAPTKRRTTEPAAKQPAHRQHAELIAANLSPAKRYFMSQDITNLILSRAEQMHVWHAVMRGCKNTSW